MSPLPVGAGSPPCREAVPACFQATQADGSLHNLRTGESIGARAPGPQLGDTQPRDGRCDDQPRSPATPPKERPMTQPRCIQPATLQFGVCVLATDRSLSPPRLAQEVEARGIDLLLFPENSHMPVDRRPDWPPVAGLLDPLSRLYDPFVALAGAAAVTQTLLLGFAVCLMTHRDPINTAKAVASLDLMSNGRIILGVAGGALASAMRNHGSEFKHRWKITRERTLAVQQIWAQDVAEYQGEFVSFDPLCAYPKPLQTGGPPIWIGSNSKSVPDRVADYADGWIVYRDIYQGDAPADLRVACERVGRNFEELTLALMNAPREVALAQAFIERGFRKLVFILPQAGPEILHELDQIAALAAQLRAMSL